MPDEFPSLTNWMAPSIALSNRRPELCYYVMDIVTDLHASATFLHRWKGHITTSYTDTFLNDTACIAGTNFAIADLLKDNCRDCLISIERLAERLDKGYNHTGMNYKLTAGDYSDTIHFHYLRTQYCVWDHTPEGVRYFAPNDFVLYQPQYYTDERALALEGALRLGPASTRAAIAQVPNKKLRRLIRI